MYTAMKLGGYTASEADFLRKAVAKKNEAELLKNRERFLEGAKQNDVPEEAANKIFNDWEAFARYGFPKGHAADYAVLAVETAYLKHHYTVEYMTALISVYHSDTDRVAGYVQDTINQGIEVLPPDVNNSCYDFSIEDGEDGESCVRFGLGAVKNVGHGPVDMILEGREDGPFEDLTDFANRVDLRKVGKRALESLIKVGALDSFGPRMALLDAMERAISVSGSKFQAEEIGQMTFFNNGDGLVQKITLPQIDPNYNRREQLNWERELVGMYVSDHPLRQTAKALDNVITHYSAELAQQENDTFVRVFGEIVRIAKIMTKKGKEMAFVRLEDTRGFTKLVLFPETWKRFSGMLNYGKVIVAEGKVDLSRGEPNILVDDLKFELHLDTEAADQIVRAMNGLEIGGGDELPEMNEEFVSESEFTQAAPDQIDHPVAEPEDEGPKQEPVIRENPPLDEYALPEPEPSPPYNIWNGSQDDEKAREQLIEEPVQPEPVMAEPAEEYQTPPDIREPDAVEKPEVPETEVAVPPIAPEPQVVEEVEVAAAKPPITAPPEPAGQVERKGAPQMLTVVMRSLGDKERDILRMRRVYGMLISDPGPDRFAFYVIERSRGYRLEFPSDTTHLSDDLRRRLENLMGAENVIVEPITIQ